MEHIEPADVLRLLETVGESVWRRSLVTDEITFTMGVWTSLGYTEAEAPKTLDEALVLFHPEDVTRILAELDKYLAGQVDDYRSQTRVRACNGDWRWLRIVGGVISRGSEGEPASLGGVISDITEDVCQQREQAMARQRLGKLTPREEDVLAGIINGQTSRDVAERLSISSRTVESYRARIMDKLEARSVPALVKLCEKAAWGNVRHRAGS